MSESDRLLRSERELLQSYVSPLLERRLRQPQPVVVPEISATRGAVVLIDVERFSVFAERMAAMGNDGVERLAERINQTFAAAVESITRYGGIAHAFPGDSVIAFWPADERTLDARTLEESVLLATRCALELVETHRDDELPLKAGLSAGELTMAHLGGVNGRLQFLLSGAPLDEMGRAEERSGRGRLIAAAPAWNLLSRHAVASVESDGFFEVKTLRAAAPIAVPAESASAASLRTEDAAFHATARAYLPAALIRHLEADQGAWLGEFREVTVAFIQIRTTGVQANDMAEIQRAFVSIQEAVFRHGGDITRFAHDDKGLAALAVFGLPPASSEDSATRAVAAAVEIEGHTRRATWRCRIGLSTGRVFCGMLGAPRRREFSVVGSTPNLAARLMQSLDGGVLCDAVTARAANHAFESAGRLRPKGFPEPMEVFRPASSAGSGALSAPADAEVDSGLVGRDSERHRLHSWVDRLREHASGGLYVVDGEAGIGKTALLGQGVAHARASGVEVFWITCRASESAGAYGAWAKALAALLQWDRVRGERDRVDLLRQALVAAGAHEQLMPLLGPVLGIEIEDNQTTREMGGAARRDNLLALLSRLVGHLATRRRELGGTLLLAFEDVHWLDAASWELMRVVSHGLEKSGMGLLLTLRTMVLPDGGTPGAVLEDPLAERLGLGALTALQTQEMARRLLRARSLQPQVAQLVFERTRGNPFFCTQLVLAMSESGLVGVDDGEAMLRVRTPEQVENLIPRTVAAVLTGRLDRLPAPVQLTIKAASVIGAGFHPDLLTVVHPMRHDRETLDAHLASAIELGLIEKDREDVGSVRFCHSLTCDVAYGLLLASQQRQLHREIAEALGSQEESTASQAALFYHWRRSGDEAQALRHVDEAGGEAMRNGNYHAVIEYYGYALGVVAKGGAAKENRPVTGGFRRETQWSAHLGQARVALGLHEAARPELERCLEELGEAVPTTLPAVYAAVGLQAGRQLLHRAYLRRFEGRRSSEAAALSLAAATYEQLGYVYYSAGETIHGLHAALRILNLTELAGRFDLMAQSYGVMSLTMSVIGLRRFASLYDRRAVRLARESDDPFTQAYVGWVTALRAVGEADWGLLAMRIESSLKVSRRLGDLRMTVVALQCAGWGPYIRGDFARAGEIAEEQIVVARETNNRLWESWGLNAASEALSMAGDHEAVIRNCQRSLEILTEESDRVEEIRSLGLTALAKHRSGRADEATNFVRRALERSNKIEMTSFMMYVGLSSMVDVLLCMVEEGQSCGVSPVPTLRRDLKQGLSTFARFASAFPMGRTRLHVFRARAAVLAGAIPLAQREFNHALRSADDHAMPHEKGLALLAAARSSALDATSRRRRAQEAIEILRGGEARSDAERTLRELGERSL